MRGATVQPTFRPRRDQDDAFLLMVGRRAFAPWSRDPTRALTGMVGTPSSATEIAWLDADRVGFFVVGFERLRRPFGPWNDPIVSRLDAVAVVANEQRRGIGRALVARAERVAQGRGAVVMSLMTASKNVVARRLFERAGFLPLVRVPDSYANGDSAIEMFKALDPG